jgi:hypothetical protein
MLTFSWGDGDSFAIISLEQGSCGVSIESLAHLSKTGAALAGGAGVIRALGAHDERLSRDGHRIRAASVLTSSFSEISSQFEVAHDG